MQPLILQQAHRFLVSEILDDRGETPTQILQATLQRTLGNPEQTRQSLRVGTPSCKSVAEANAHRLFEVARRARRELELCGDLLQRPVQVGIGGVDPPLPGVAWSMRRLAQGWA